MYIPSFFVQPSVSKMQDLMRAYPFAVLISADPSGSIDAQHLPVTLNTCLLYTSPSPRDRG